MNQQSFKIILRKFPTSTPKDDARATLICINNFSPSEPKNIFINYERSKLLSFVETFLSKDIANLSCAKLDNK